MWLARLGPLPSTPPPTCRALPSPPLPPKQGPSVTCGLNAYKAADGSCACYANNIPMGDGANNCCRPNSAVVNGVCKCKAGYTWVDPACGARPKSIAISSCLMLALGFHVRGPSSPTIPHSRGALRGAPSRAFEHAPP
jgi:hypothetical protein